ncbi:MAG TPA: class I SAM-dependent methyltransferase [Xanthomonadales bacterium]|nr:class I SAM-dependent methyltransferase [Xanthomonadales bacterium]
MDLPPDAQVADLGCGTGAGSRLLRDEFGFAVTGFDLSAENVAWASTNHPAANCCGPLSDGPGQLEFRQANVLQLPVANASFDGLLLECVFSLLPDAVAALEEFRRVLKPGGVIGLSDMSIEGELPAGLAEKVAPWTCLLNARSENAYREQFERAGFEVADCSDESAGLVELLRTLQRKLLTLSTGAVLGEKLPVDFDLAEVVRLLRAFQAEVDRGTIRYLRFELRMKD